MQDKKINTAIIGFGLSGKVFHAPFLHTHSGFNLKKIVERNHNHSKKIYPYVEVLSDYKELLEDQSLDLIVVATPNTTHYTMVKECLLAGKHVVVEKPFTPTAKEADELIEIAKTQKKNIFVYHNRRWDGDFLTIQKMLNDHILGDIYEYEAHFDRYTPKLSSNWRDENKAGGGILFDLGAHLIHQAICLFGSPKKIKANIQSQRKNSPVDDYFRLELKYPQAKIILTAGMMVKELGPRFTLKGSKGIFTKYGIDPQEESLKKGLMPNKNNWGQEDLKNWGKIASGNTYKQIETIAGNYMGFYNNVYDVMINHKEMIVKPEEAREVIRIIEKSFMLNEA